MSSTPFLHENFPNNTFWHGIQLFDAEQYFECHEVLEGLWLPLAADDPLKQYYQGWIQVAVGMHHYQRGNRLGAKNKLQAGMNKLNATQAHYWPMPEKTEALVERCLTALQTA